MVQWSIHYLYRWNWESQKVTKNIHWLTFYVQTIKYSGALFPTGISRIPKTLLESIDYRIEACLSRIGKRIAYNQIQKDKTKIKNGRNGRR
jgi:hypothetical protein